MHVSLQRTFHATDSHIIFLDILRQAHCVGITHRVLIFIFVLKHIQLVRYVSPEIDGQLMIRTDLVGLS